MINTESKISILEMAKNIDKSSSNQTSVNIENFCEEFHINTILLRSDSDNLFCQRVKAYWQQSWYCDYETVGVAFYYFDDEFVALSVQEGKKSDLQFEFASEEAVIKLMSFVHLLLGNGLGFISTLNPDDEIHEYYNLTSKSEFIDRYEGVYQGRPALAFKTPDCGKDKNFVDKIRIEFTDSEGGEAVIPIMEFKIRYHC